MEENMDDVKPFIYPGDDGSKLKPGSRYENFIGGDWTKPKTGNYFENISPTSGKVICEIPRSNADDVNLALDAAHKAAPGWGKTGPAERSNILLKIQFPKPAIAPMGPPYIKPPRLF